jgi:hypothetical protein
MIVFTGMPIATIWIGSEAATLISQVRLFVGAAVNTTGKLLFVPEYTHVFFTNLATTEITIIEKRAFRRICT